jgi:hypothetical protein
MPGGGVSGSNIMGATMVGRLGDGAIIKMVSDGDLGEASRCSMNLDCLRLRVGRVGETGVGGEVLTVKGNGPDLAGCLGVDSTSWNVIKGRRSDLAGGFGVFNRSSTCCCSLGVTGGLGVPATRAGSILANLGEIDESLFECECMLCLECSTDVLLEFILDW